MRWPEASLSDIKDNISDINSDYSHIKLYLLLLITPFCFVNVFSVLCILKRSLSLELGMHETRFEIY